MRTKSKFSAEQVRECLAVLDAASSSGMTLQGYAQARGLAYQQLRGWAAQAPRWRGLLAGCREDEAVQLAPARFVAAAMPTAVGGGQPVLHADETPVSELKPGAGKTHRAYVWVYRSAGAVVYDYRGSRGGEHAREFLRGWSGTLVVDDFSGYKALFVGGANLAIIEAKSPGELLFREQVGDIWLASPIQVYLDLLRSEGRAKEMAEHLRQERIGF